MAPVAALVFAGKSVATSAITYLVNKAFDYLVRYRKSEGIEEVKKRILVLVPDVQVVFDAINPEYIREKSSSLDAWLWKLRDALEEAEDAIDEIEYYELAEKAKDRKVSDWGSSWAKLNHKAVKSITGTSMVDKTIKCWTHRGALKRLRKAVKDLDKVAGGVVDFLELAKHVKGCPSEQEEHLINDDRETGSMLTITKVFGRKKEEVLVTGWLTKTDQISEISVANHVSVVSIVGHGGMGKTTLAQCIYNSRDVKRHFGMVIWASVSTNFIAKTIICNILESATLKKPVANSLEALQKILREILEPLKFLLVLDDVWEDMNEAQWEKLFAPLREGKIGSKILLTTRMQSVADCAMKLMAGSSATECLKLQGLEEKENLELFNHHAFSNLTIQDYSYLQPTGDRIAKKLRGCPLVTKVIGAHLRDNMDFEYWGIFFHESLEHFEVTAEDIMKVLKLSYYHLSTKLQTCFRYCSILPRGGEIGKEDLVKMWMCSGLISRDEPRSLQVIVQNYLVPLTKKSFLELRFRKSNLGIVHEESGYYVMHDLMHDLAKYVSFGECAQIVDVASAGNIARTVRHIRVVDINRFPVEEIKKITNLKNLRTIIISDSHEEIKSDILNTIEELVRKSKSLRLFQTELFHTTQFLSKLAKLRHLRFIILQLTSTRPLRGIVKMYHLTVLELHCNDVAIKQKHIRDLGNLDCLQYVTCGSAEFVNLHVDRLTSLQTLQHYHIEEGKGYMISALKELSSLRRLVLKGLENVKLKEAEGAKLKEKQYLISLSLQWSECSDAQSGIDDLILENLEPHANLRELQIIGYNGANLPNWIAEPFIRNLRVLELKSCTNLELLTPLTELLVLKHVDLNNLLRLKKIGQSIDASISLSPNLRTLVVIGCPELQELPLLPPSLVSLEITRVGLTKLPRIGKSQSENDITESSQLLYVSVTKCPSLASFDGSLLEQEEYMGVLIDLKLEGSEHLESTSLTFASMNQLRELHIRNCPVLKMLPPSRRYGLLPLSLRKLHISKCGAVAVALIESLHELSNLSGLELEHCSGLTSLPPPDVFMSLKSLKSVDIIECEDLRSFGGLGFLTSRFRLKISGCNKLMEVQASQIPGTSSDKEECLAVPSNSLQIHSLGIDLPSLLLVEPLKSLQHTQSLSIQDASAMDSLPEQWLLQNSASLRYLDIHSAKSLELLPSRMQDLSALEMLTLFSTEQLRTLPCLPSSLQKLCIWGCNTELEAKCTENGSPEWNNISHIPRVQIGNLRWIMGKQCSQKTYDMLWGSDYATLSSWVNQPENDGNVESALQWWKKQFCLLNTC
ncbi:unnamed protein product [Urochloa decumbens]|uniref:Uncharacterized protein n=2 Tax=Urochloa decumbens TaxID=240449 RepID=A0ABC9F0Y1_9POAL